MSLASEKLRGLSPLELTKGIKEIELYNKEEAVEIFKQIDDEFKGKEGLFNQLIMPSMLNIIDNIMKKKKLGSKYNLSATEVLEECKNFEYDAKDCKEQDKREYKIEDEVEIKGIHNSSREKYDRSKYEDKKKLKDYEDRKFAGNKTVKCEYDGKVIYRDNDDMEKRNFKKETEHKSNIDHVVPLKERFDQVKDNFAIKDSDIKEMMNIDENFAAVNSSLNKSKGAKTNEEFLKWSEDRGKEVNPDTVQRMRNTEKQANIAIDKEHNKRVVKNLTTDKTVRKEFTNGAKKQAAEAGKAGVDDAIGRTVLEFLKATFYEIKESFKNGIKYNLNASTKIEAFKVRMKRAIQYVSSKMKDIFDGVMKNVVMEFLGSLAKIVINLFVGVVKRGFDIIRKGFASIVQAIKILMKPASEMSGLEKADSFVKIIVTAATMILGEGLEVYIERVPFLAPFADYISPILSGLLSTIIIYMLDKIDIFGLKHERKIARIEEVFSLRIKEINGDRKEFNIIVEDVLNAHKTSFDELTDSLKGSMEDKDYDKMDNITRKIAEFMGIELKYSTDEEYIEYLESEECFEF